MKQIEAARMAKIEDLIPKHKELGWDWTFCDIEIDQPLKFITMTRMYDNTMKFKCLGNKSLFQYLLEMFDNHTIEYEQKVAES